MVHYTNAPGFRQPSISDEFILLLPSLTPLQQRVWRYLQWMCSKFNNVFPSHETIARACRCSRRSVITAICVFRDKGWIAVKKRAYKSCLYWILPKLLQIDTTIKKTFTKKKVKPGTPTNSELRAVNQFKATYQLLSPKQKQIWEILHDRSSRYSFPFTSYREISMICCCSFETIKTALKKFSTQFLTEIIRVKNRSVIIMPDALQGLDFKNPETFYREEHVSNADRLRGVDQNACCQAQFVLKKSGLDDDEIQKLIKYPLHVIRLAAEDLETYRQRRHVRNVAAFLTSRCKSYAKVGKAS